MTIERSSPSRTAGRRTREITIAGETLTLSQPQRFDIFAEEEELVLSRRLDHVSFAIEACRRLPPNRHASVWEGVGAAYSRGIATQEEWDAYQGSLWKPAFMLYRAMDPQHTKDKTLLQNVRWCIDLLRTLTDDEQACLWTAVRFVSQEDDIKNSSGPSANSGTPKTDDPSTTDTPPSTPFSPRTTTGPTMT